MKYRNNLFYVLAKKKKNIQGFLACKFAALELPICDGKPLLFII